MALRVGELIYRPPGDGDIRGQAEDEAFAWGTGLLRQTEVYGTFFDERFHFEQLELERLQLIQAEQAWIGQLAQTIGAAYEGPTGRALVQQLRAGAVIRRSAGAHSTDCAAARSDHADKIGFLEQRNDVLRQKPQDRQNNDDDGAPLDGFTAYGIASHASAATTDIVSVPHASVFVFGHG